jgi:hypothetical protein
VESGLSAVADDVEGGDSRKVCSGTFSRHGFSAAGRNQRKNPAGDKTQQTFTVFSLEQVMIDNFTQKSSRLRRCGIALDRTFAQAQI